jgi:hypothetical protein
LEFRRPAYFVPAHDGAASHYRAQADGKSATILLVRDQRLQSGQALLQIGNLLRLSLDLPLLLVDHVLLLGSRAS